MSEQDDTPQNGDQIDNFSNVTYTGVQGYFTNSKNKMRGCEKNAGTPILAIFTIILQKYMINVSQLKERRVTKNQTPNQRWHAPRDCFCQTGVFVINQTSMRERIEIIKRGEVQSERDDGGAVAIHGEEPTWKEETRKKVWGST